MLFLKTRRFLIRYNRSNTNINYKALIEHLSCIRFLVSVSAAILADAAVPTAAQYCHC